MRATASRYFTCASIIVRPRGRFNDLRNTPEANGGAMMWGVLHCWTIKNTQYLFKLAMKR